VEVNWFGLGKRKVAMGRFGYWWADRVGLPTGFGFLSISPFLILILFLTQTKRIQINLNSNSNQTTKEKMLQHECNNKV
jgi:hypothetical protein